MRVTLTPSCQIGPWPTTSEWEGLARSVDLIVVLDDLTHPRYRSLVPQWKKSLIKAELPALYLPLRPSLFPDYDRITELRAQEVARFLANRLRLYIQESNGGGAGTVVGIRALTINGQPPVGLIRLAKGLFLPERRDVHLFLEQLSRLNQERRCPLRISIERLGDHSQAWLQEWDLPDRQKKGKYLIYVSDLDEKVKARGLIDGRGRLFTTKGSLLATKVMGAELNQLVLSGIFR